MKLPTQTLRRDFPFMAIDRLMFLAAAGFQGGHGRYWPPAGVAIPGNVRPQHEHTGICAKRAARLVAALQPRRPMNKVRSCSGYFHFMPFMHIIRRQSPPWRDIHTTNLWGNS